MLLRHAEVELDPYGIIVLMAGASGGGKATKTSSLLERLAEAGYQYVVIVEEANQLLPPEWNPAALTFPQKMRGLRFITVHPVRVAPVR